MCYDAKQQVRRQLKYARHIGASSEIIAELETELEKLEKMTPPLYHASGFSHPNLLVFANDEPYKPRFFNWGLIPYWVKDAKSAVTISNQTLNARGETIFDKPAFREAAKKRRCIIPLDGFYEHHHANNRAYPFHIKLKSGESMYVAGLWEKWNHNGDEPRYTVSIVTTTANPLMTKIHNNPNAEAGPRMPLIIHPEQINDWLKPINDDLDKQLIKDLIRPYDESEMEAFTVRTLRGKNAIGNKEEACEEFNYDDFNSKELLKIA